MDFNSKILKELFESNSLPENHVISEGITLKGFYDIVKKLLGLSVDKILKLATDGGSVSENIIEINTLIIEDEHADWFEYKYGLQSAKEEPEDFSHIKLDDNSDPLDLDIKKRRRIPTLTVHTIVNGNYAKIVKINIKTEGISFVGYIPVKVTVSNDSIFKDIKISLLKKQQIKIPWYNTIKQAMSVMTDIESTEKQEQIRKHDQQLNAQINPQFDPRKRIKIPVPQELQTNKFDLIKKIAASMLTKTGNNKLVDKVKQLSDDKLKLALKNGMKTISKSSVYPLFKTIFLSYLSLSALVYGVPGIAALIVGYLITKGIDSI
jgi:hypothetical protein